MGNPWFPFYMGEYLRDTQHLSTLEHGAYLKLIIHYYATQEPIPNDDELLRQITCLTKHNWKKISLKIKNLFEINEKSLVQKRIEQELAKTKNISEIRRIAALKSHRSRSEAEKDSSISTANAKLLQVQSQPQSQPQKKEKSTPLPPKGGIFSVGLPASHDTPEVRSAFMDWLGYKQEKNQKYKPRGLKALVTQKCNDYSPETLVAAIRSSMSNNYTGIFPAKTVTDNGQPLSKSKQRMQELYEMNRQAAEDEEKQKEQE